jgi:hypothetical protein
MIRLSKVVFHNDLRNDIVINANIRSGTVILPICTILIMGPFLGFYIVKRLIGLDLEEYDILLARRMAMNSISSKTIPKGNRQHGSERRSTS